jgi:hypothetical protein
MGGLSATSLRRNIAAIIFKQAAPGRSIFSSGTRRYSNRRLDRSLELFSRLREGYFVGNATSSSHPVPGSLSNQTNLSILFALLAHRLASRRSKNECGIIHGGLEEKKEFERKEYGEDGERKEREVAQYVMRKKKPSSFALVPNWRPLLCVRKLILDSEIITNSFT